MMLAAALATGCASAPPPAAPTAASVPSPARQPEPVVKVTAMPQTALAAGQALAAPAGVAKVDNVALGRRRDGRPVMLADYRGRIALVNFWSSRCPPCVGELAAIEGLRREYEKRGLAVLAVNFGEKPAEADRFLARQRAPLQLTQLLDSDRSAARGLGVRAVPATLLFDTRGRLVSRYGGYSGLNVSALRAEIDRLLVKN